MWFGRGQVTPPDLHPSRRCPSPPRAELPSKGRHFLEHRMPAGAVYRLRSAAGRDGVQASPGATAGADANLVDTNVLSSREHRAPRPRWEADPWGVGGLPGTGFLGHYARRSRASGEGRLPPEFLPDCLAGRIRRDLPGRRTSTVSGMPSSHKPLATRRGTATEPLKRVPHRRASSRIVPVSHSNSSMILLADQHAIPAQATEQISPATGFDAHSGTSIRRFQTNHHPYTAVSNSPPTNVAHWPCAMSAQLVTRGVAPLINGLHSKRSCQTTLNRTNARLGSTLRSGVPPEVK